MVPCSNLCGTARLMLATSSTRVPSLHSDRYGKRAGAQVTAITESGTNQFHGSVFEFVRNSALDARNFFDQGPIPAFRRNQFGASAGGPVTKDRFFLFGSYEGLRHRLGISSVSVVPDDNSRRGLQPNGAPVPNLRPEMLNYMALWPQPNGPEVLTPGPSGTAYSYNIAKQSINEDFGTARADYNPRNEDSVSASYTIDAGNNLTPLADPLFGNYITLRSQVASIHATHIFSDRKSVV